MGTTTISSVLVRSSSQYGYINNIFIYNYSGFRAQGSGLRVQGSGFRAHGSGFRGQKMSFAL
jgi:hypothetical protein